MTQTIKEIQTRIKLINDLNDPYLETLNVDPRKGVQDLLKRKKKLLLHQAELYRAYLERLNFDHQLLTSQNYQFLAGVDEVGRGPIAGPVVAAAVVLPEDTSDWIEVNDSKALSHHKRCALAEVIKQQAKAYAITSLSPSTIDRLNIYEASRLAMKEAVLKLGVNVDLLAVDAMKLDLKVDQVSLTKGDQKSLSIAAASIIAKVYRDQIMIDYAEQYPEFAFDQHMGYPTKQHLANINKYGFTSIHRQSYGPVQAVKHYYGS
ncbi:ribonuclease HII [Facklamia miroungae]|uniref:Ribonuclease HII n=1 Tax=Facklamia miroungae TaxID=120956 RepID=A0A1G7P7Q7_9LACT|nr:ribonuclease HII [Facklamia miroungae]NKZ28608.1 ribonuclease HII [Facklamia miroungae]SDF82177.1 RNase HII [Facklamia miroungae]